MRPLLVRMARTIATADGVLLVDKPAGITSHDVVALARRSLGTRRVGHSGTLDPFATGLLIVLVGQATRLARFVEDEPKVYDATITFGAETDTDDVTGEVVRTADRPAAADVYAGIRALTGRILQRPPAYSAKQVQGRRAYAAARVGAPLTLEPVEVMVDAWSVRHLSPSKLDATITCGGGTYIRALARDLGRLTGSAAHLSVLRRIRSGVFDVRHARTVDELRASPVHLESMRMAIPNLPSQSLEEAEVTRIRNGQPIPARAHGSVVVLVDGNGDLVALANRDGDVIRPSVVMHFGR
jgi:tRNA pseudouridine55 synthase